jgi:P27 family predicted phage terminase small subunit
MATANAGRKASSHLKLVDPGRGAGRDSGGRLIPETPAFHRAVPQKPHDLSEVAGRMWDAVVAELPRLNLLKPLDAFALEVGCETYARWHAAKRLRLGRDQSGLLAKTSQGVGVSPLVRVESEASREFRAWCAEFGLTPAAEVKLSAAQDPGNGSELF